MAFYQSYKRMIALVTVFFIPELVQMFGSLILFDSSLMRELFWSAVRSREDSGMKRGDYIDTVIELKNGKQDPLYKFANENLVYQAGTFFSGFESSSTVLAFTLMELAKHKTCQDRVRAEIKETTRKYGWGMEAFSNMKYTEQCIFEGIRLHPPISTIDRTAIHEYKIPGTNITIPRGTAVFVSLYGVHGDARYFPDPLRFNPERFDSGNKHHGYMPFGIGPRQCVGVKVGLLHIKVVLSMILSEYEVHDSSDQLMLDPRCTFTAAAHGINIGFTRI